MYRCKRLGIKALQQEGSLIVKLESQKSGGLILVVIVDLVVPTAYHQFISDSYILDGIT
jgi:hypothetical protein